MTRGHCLICVKMVDCDPMQGAGSGTSHCSSLLPGIHKKLIKKSKQKSPLTRQNQIGQIKTKKMMVLELRLLITILNNSYMHVLIFKFEIKIFFSLKILLVYYFI